MNRLALGGASRATAASTAGVGVSAGCSKHLGDLPAAELVAVDERQDGLQAALLRPLVAREGAVEQGAEVAAVGQARRALSSRARR